MATYKVPQDVEADDKLIGPFSFRQFIYLIIVVLAGGAAWGLAQLFIGLAIIPLPVILLFGALALPLRKDQPMEIYLAAIVSFYLKPHKRLWNPDGTESLIEITAPKTIEKVLTKNISADDADQRFGYLASLVDSQGWAIRGASDGNTTVNNDVFLEAQGTNDVLDTNSSVAQNFGTMMMQSTEKIKEEAIERMTQPAPAPASQPAQAAPAFNPYPAFNQAVVQPLGDAAHAYQVPVQPTPQVAPIAPPWSVPQPAENPPSAQAVSPDIINLANNADLSIETMAREAHRIHDKEERDLSEEVVISLR